MMFWPIVLWTLGGLLLLLVGVVAYDLTQKRHAILRNFPVIGHFRYLLEMVGPELRQYIVTNNNEERPFSRDQRSWVYTSAKRLNNYFGFGSDNEMEAVSSYTILKQATFPHPEVLKGQPGYDEHHPLPCAKVLGGVRGRAKAFRPRSVVNTSAMSFGSLSAPAVEAINRGAALAGCLQNTGEGGVAPHHGHGGELIWQIGTGYFGCRDEGGQFSLDRFKETVQRFPIKAVEIKISQGAKPGHGGILPGAKVTPEIAAIRGVKVGQDCLSPAYHTAFSSADGLLDFVELLAAETGLPVGIKSAVGQEDFWIDLANLMARGDRGIDFLTIDGGEGGTGAAPLAFTDHVALPFKLGMSRVYRIFAERDRLDQKLVWVGSGKLGFPERAMFAFGLGCDLLAVGREAMLAVGCIQAQRCHTGHCPTGVATQNRWLMRGLDPTNKAARLANYICNLRGELLALAHAAGHPHPAFLRGDQLETLEEGFHSHTLIETFGYQQDWGLAAAADLAAVRELMAAA
jgi:glutamate synthase domain-containing protein 2